MEKSLECRLNSTQNKLKNETSNLAGTSSNEDTVIMARTTQQTQESISDNTISPNSVSTHNTSKHSKQLNYYYNHREQINTNRRTKYKLTNPHNKTTNILKTKKPNDVLEIVNSSLNEIDNSQNIPILSLFDMLKYAQTTLTPEREATLIVPMKTTNIFVLPEIVQYTTFNEQASFGELERFFKDKVSKRQLKRAVQLLVNLKWLIRRGKNDFTVYYPNPFLTALFDNNKQFLLLAEYARLKIDFFSLLNMPLINALRSNQRIERTEVTFHKYSMGEAKPWVRAWFEGYVNIKLHAENGDIYQTYLPVNFHASPKIVGYDPKTKKPITDPYGFPHHTLNLSWSLFDVIEGREYTKKGRESRRSKDVGEYMYIPF